MGETKLSKITQEDKYQIYINEHIENVMRAWYNMKNIQPLKLIIIINLFYCICIISFVIITCIYSFHVHSSIINFVC